MAIYKISTHPTNYDRLEEVVASLSEAMIMKATTYEADNDIIDDAYTIAFLRLNHYEDLSYILLMVGGQQLRHP